ncbi:hypothetical protein OESDEN_18163, partial [Oesophagostomum dentatum]
MATAIASSDVLIAQQPNEACPEGLPPQTQELINVGKQRMLVSNIGVPGPEEKKEQYQDSVNRSRVKNLARSHGPSPLDRLVILQQFVLYVRKFIKNAHVLANRKCPDITFKKGILQIGKDHTLTPTMAVVLFNINMEEWNGLPLECLLTNHEKESIQ